MALEEPKSVATKPVSAAKVMPYANIKMLYTLSVIVSMAYIFFSPHPLKAPPPKCPDCRQYLDDSDLKLFQGDPDNAVRNHIFYIHGRL